MAYYGTPEYTFVLCTVRQDVAVAVDNVCGECGSTAHDRELDTNA